MDSMVRVLHEGGLVLVAIAVASVVAWALIFAKWLELRTERAAVLATGGAGELELEGPRVRQIVDMWVSGERGRLLGGLLPIQALAALLPLLGLLGTVLGMLKTFEVIKVEGTGDPRLMADGIRQALLTTQAGILGALPVLLGLRYLTSRAERLGGHIELDLHRAVFAAHKEARNGHDSAPAGRDV